MVSMAGLIIRMTRPIAAGAKTVQRARIPAPIPRPLPIYDSNAPSRRFLGTTQLMKQPLFEISLAGESRMVVSADALIDAWTGSVRDLVAIALSLPVGAGAAVFRDPSVVARRIRDTRAGATPCSCEARPCAGRAQVVKTVRVPLCRSCGTVLCADAYKTPDAV